MLYPFIIFHLVKYPDLFRIAVFQVFINCFLDNIPSVFLIILVHLFRGKPTVCTGFSCPVLFKHREVSLKPVRLLMIISGIDIPDKSGVFIPDSGKSFGIKSIMYRSLSVSEILLIPAKKSVKLRTELPVTKIIFHSLVLSCRTDAKEKLLAATENDARHPIFIFQVVISIRKLSRNGTDSRYR